MSPTIFNISMEFSFTPCILSQFLLNFWLLLVYFCLFYFIFAFMLDLLLKYSESCVWEGLFPELIVSCVSSEHSVWWAL